MSPRSCRLLVLVVLLATLFPASLASTFWISGTVLSPEGLPLPEARVRLLPAPDALQRARSEGEPLPAAALALTDSSGYYEIEAPAAGVWAVQVRARAFVPVETLLAPLIEDRELPAAILDEDLGLTVTVVDEDGAAISGALVQLASARGSRSPLRRSTWHPLTQLGRSDRLGSVRLSRARGGANRLSVSGEGRALAEATRLKGSAIRVTLQQGRALPLRILSDNGTPVPDALVRLGETLHPVGVSDSSGRLTVNLLPGAELSSSVSASHGRHSESHLAIVGKGDEAAQEITLVLPSAFMIEGRLIDAQTREPLVGGVIWLQRDPSLAVRTGAGGSFRLPGNANESSRLRAGAAGYLPDRGLRITPDGVRVAPPTLALEPGAKITGRVIDETGRGVAGAEVSPSVVRRGGNMIRIEIGDATPSASAFTDTEGFFQLGPIDPSKNWEIKARHSGFAPASREIGALRPYETKGGQDIEFESGLRAAGLVTSSDGAPLANAEVTFTKSKGGHGGVRFVMPGEEKDAPLTALSDLEGRYELAGLPKGRFDVEATLRGYAATMLPAVELDGESLLTEIDRIVLEDGVSLEGWVYDESGQAIEGARIEADAGGGMVFAMGGAGPETTPDALSGPNGYFRVDDLAPGSKVNVSAARRGYSKASRRGIELPPAEALQLTLSPASKVSGIVTGKEGVPIPGADVNLTRTASMSMGGNMMMMKMMSGATTDSDGRFLFEDLDPGKISLSASAPGMEEASRNDLDLPRGEDLTGIELMLKRGAIISGQVFLADSRPAIGARVAPVSQGNDPMPIGGATTDGEGRYLLDDVAIGVLSIEATLEDGNRAVREIEAREGPNKLDLHFEGGHRVTGRVADSSGAAVEGALVQLSPASRPWGGPEQRSDASGSFEFQGMRRGTYVARVSRAGFAAPLTPQKLEVQESDLSDLELRLLLGGSIEGRVTGLEEKTFAQLRVVAFAGSGEGVAEGGIDHEGRFVLKDLAPGAWSVRATLDAAGRKATAETEVQTGAPSQVVLEFGQGLTLSGTATRDGAPVGDAVINLRGSEVSASGWGRTDAKGRFTISDLAAGSYDLELREWSTGLSHREQISLSSDREIEIEIPVASIAGRVVDSQGREALAGVSISLTPASEDPGGYRFGGNGATTDLDGHFRVSNMTDGEWILKAHKKGFAATNESIHIQGGRNVEGVDLALDPTEGLILDLRLDSGLAPDQVRLALLDASGRSVLSGSYATGEGGRLRLASAPAGNWLVVIAAAGSGTLQAEVAAPGPPQVLLLPGPGTLRLRVADLAGDASIATLTLRDSRGLPHRQMGWLGDPTQSWRLSQGQATVTDLPPGEWSAEVTTPDGRRWQGQFTATAGGVSEVDL